MSASTEQPFDSRASRESSLLVAARTVGAGVNAPPRNADGEKGETTSAAPRRTPAGGGRTVDAPAAPASLRESGLSLGQLTDLILKLLYLHGGLNGFEVAGELRLPFAVVEHGLRFLKEQRCAEVTAGEMVGRISQRFVLTELGRARARDVFEQCRYIGPAPVPLALYHAQCRRQTVVGTACNRDALRRAFRDLVVPDELLDALGPAVCGGRSLFLYGPPGNGKTVIARGLGAFLNSDGGDIFVPYAIQVENSIVTVYDPSVHQATDEVASDSFAEDRAVRSHADSQPEFDRRWRRVRRPVLVSGGELTLDMLDLRHHAGSGYDTAPLHIKANGGVYLIDDFGRQIIAPAELLNRWILPLEDGVDFLTLATGKKVEFPFDQLTIFSTNIEPDKLVDAAFLRRMRHRIAIQPPTREVLTEILRRQFAAAGIAYRPEVVETLYARHYNPQRLPRSSDPRDLLEIASSLCRFRGEATDLGDAVLSEAAQRLFRTV